MYEKCGSGLGRGEGSREIKTRAPSPTVAAPFPRLRKKKNSLSSPNRCFSAYPLIHLQLINTSLISLPRPVHSLIL